MSLAASIQKSSFVVEQHDSIVMFRFDDGPLYFTGDLGARDELLQALRRHAEDPEVRVIMLMGFPEKAGSPEYGAFLRRALSTADHTAVHRVLNIFNQFVMALLHCPKLVMFVESGTVISQFINVALACDYRIVGDTTTIEKAYLRHGMVPKGAGALFLSGLVGRSRAMSLLLSETPISARQALEIGLVDEVVPTATLEEAALSRARRFARKPASTVQGIKRLLNYPLRDLESYLDFENQEVLRALRSATF